MNNKSDEQQPTACCRFTRSVGRGLILGAGIGTALMVATGNAAFLGVGIGIGMLLGHMSDSRRRRSR